MARLTTCGVVGALLYLTLYAATLVDAHADMEKSQQVSSPLLLSKLIAIDPITAAAELPVALPRLARTLYKWKGGGCNNCNPCGGGGGCRGHTGGGYPTSGGGTYSQSSSQSSSGAISGGRRK